MATSVEWVQEEPKVNWLGLPASRVQWLGQAIIPDGEMDAEAEAKAVEAEAQAKAEDKARQAEREAQAAAQTELLKEQIRRERKKISTTDKVLIGSLILGVVNFVWGVYTWRTSYQHIKSTVRPGAVV